MRKECRLKQRKGFCPVSFDRFGFLFWLLFSAASVVATVLNGFPDSPYLLGLYALPIVLLAMSRISFPLFEILGTALLGSIYIFHSPEPALIAMTAVYAALMLIIKRIVWISERHYIGKNEQRIC